uniref:Uncharacterized protein n=1 Tax=Rhizophora mucronata TaxID=61149 RepID=A0A2P2NDY5_RHIMU
MCVLSIFETQNYTIV